MNKAKKYSYLFIFILMISFFMQPLQAEKQITNDKSSLHTARNYLSTAFENYNKGNVTTARKNLKQASEWLNKAIEHSKSDKVKTEAEKLSIEIEKFRSTLKNSSKKQQNSMARFWHRATSLIKRESEHIIHSYTESQNDNITLKYILNAKMNFYVADHDLFVSHDSKDSEKELNESLRNLTKADEIARPDIKIFIQKLMTNIKTLVKLTESSKECWKKDKLVHSLDKAISNLTSAEISASPATTLKIKLLEKNIYQLKLDIQKTNLKTRYDSIMIDFKQIINNI